MMENVGCVNVVVSAMHLPSIDRCIEVYSLEWTPLKGNELPDRLTQVKAES